MILTFKSKIYLENKPLDGIKRAGWNIEEKDTIARAIFLDFRDHIEVDYIESNNNIGSIEVCVSDL